MRDPRWRIAGPLIGLAVLIVLPLVLYPVLALEIVTWGLFAVALDLLLGFVGVLSFGHAAFWGTGGYAAGILARSLGLAFPLAVLGGVVCSALLALVFGYLAIRRRGIYFAMVTLAFSQMVYYVANEWRALTGGENGLQGIPHALGDFELTDPRAFYYTALPFLLLSFWLAHRVVHSPFGHVLVAIRDNEARAQALGYPTFRYKLLAFVISAALAGAAGALFTLGHSFASLDLVDWRTSGTVVVMTILGGIGTLWGSVFGAAIFLLLRDSLSTFTDAWGVITGSVFVVVVLAFRRGVWGSFLFARPTAASAPPMPPAPAAPPSSGAHRGSI
ncbi:MAG: branched-chain amino acid ABC transporter permease [Chloroflexota bacterium]|nr:branched-chain amino acid ABC transporter permease [Chloroflexota bacterium]